MNNSFENNNLNNLEFPESAAEDSIEKLELDKASEIQEELRTIDSRLGKVEVNMAEGIRSKVLDALQSFYSKAKSNARILPILLVLGGSEKPLFQNTGNPDVSAEAQEADLKLPVWAKFADFFLGGSVKDALQKLEDFEKTRNKDGSMSQPELDFREKLAQDIMPIGYDPLNPAIDLALDRRKYSKEKLDQMNLGRQIRQDLFRHYLGLKTYYEYLQLSSDRPGREKDPQSRYMAFPKEKIVSQMKKRGIVDFASLEEYVRKNNKMGPNFFTNQLGTYKTEISFDPARKERFVSYYDYWNIEPPIAKSLGVSIDKHNFPFEIYGRIYESDF